MDAKRGFSKNMFKNIKRHLQLKSGLKNGATKLVGQILMAGEGVYGRVSLMLKMLTDSAWIKNFL